MSRGQQAVRVHRLSILAEVGVERLQHYLGLELAAKLLSRHPDLLIITD